MKINLNVFTADLSMEFHGIYYLYIYWNVFISFFVSLWNLSVHVFIKLILSELIYFEGRVCYIGEIKPIHAPDSFQLCT